MFKKLFCYSLSQV